MANDEVIGPRKTMFVLVIVVGCFAVLWPRILSPLVLGPTREQIQPNQFDREAGCCEVIFETDVAVLELVNEVCSSAMGVGKLSPHSAAECRKAVNETCGVDIAVFLKRNENVGKTTKMLVETMQNSNSSCLREHFGVPVYSLGPHLASKSWDIKDTLKQERAPPMRGMGPHPALRERGRAIPPGPPGPPPPPARPVVLPPHVRVRSPLSVYYEVEQPPPIPGMRPPLGSPGGPVPTPKSTMGFVMPVYTICIIVFFAYTLSKIMFRRTAVPYDPVAPDPQFRRRVFRDDSRSSPDKLGKKEADTRDAELAALRARLAETERAMQRIVGQLARRDADVQDNARPYTNGTILLNTGPVQIVASEYKESKEKTPEPVNEQEATPEPNEAEPTKSKEPSPEPKLTTEPENSQTNLVEDSSVPEETLIDLNEAIADVKTQKEDDEELVNLKEEKEISSEDIEIVTDKENELIKVFEGTEAKDDSHKKATEKFLDEQRFVLVSKPDVTEESKNAGFPEEDLEEEEIENAAVKVVGMELTAHPADGGAWPRDLRPAPRAAPAPAPHEAEEVKSIFLETEIPQQSRVLVAQFAQDREQSDKPRPAKHAPLVVSGKMTLSLIQDAPRETPERDPESTLDDFTTASALTQPAAEKGEMESDEEVDEEIEVEEIEEEYEEDEEDEEAPAPAPVKAVKK
ncbi:uncharacterized protein RIC-3 isoform X7 [Epargyreus clarus]|uniref:uncharacterized protein RIC-3 isoform X7 n=1 Tax=Epargyreus clarus TaxID=520877 RepID=UPI003C2E50C3